MLGNVAGEIGWFSGVMRMGWFVLWAMINLGWIMRKRSINNEERRRLEMKKRDGR